MSASPLAKTMSWTGSWNANRFYSSMLFCYFRRTDDEDSAGSDNDFSLSMLSAKAKQGWFKCINSVSSRSSLSIDDIRKVVAVKLLHIILTPLVPVWNQSILLYYVNFRANHFFSSVRISNMDGSNVM